MSANVGRSPQLQALLELPRDKRRDRIRSLSREDQINLLYCWEFWGRKEQVWRPGPESITGYLAGRGWGKTRVGAEATNFVAQNPQYCGGRACEGSDDLDYGVGGTITIAGATSNDIRKAMLFGPSGLMTISDPRFMPVYYHSKLSVEWPNGVVAHIVSGEKPSRARSLNTGFLWCDELAHWARLTETWDNLMLGLRHGDHPRCVITTTPLGVQGLIEICFECDEDKQPIAEHNDFGFRVKDDVRLVSGSTYDNATNLAERYIDQTVGRFEGTRLGDQEIRGQILMDVPGALWERGWFKRCNEDEVPELVAVVIAVDPAVSEGAKSAETGIVLAGLGVDDVVYLLRDRTGKYSPKAWGTVVVTDYRDFDVDTVCGELNQGGNLVERNLAAIETPRKLKFEGLTASKSKAIRWGSVAGYWENGRVVHVGPARRWVKVEHQLTHFDPAKPDKEQLLDAGDAAVWALIACLGGRNDRKKLRALGKVDVWKAVAKGLAARRRK